jgi:tetratricopeptide (TPR) repeat protein
MLAGNTEAIAADAATSVIDFVDELCLINTGITDNTIGVVRDAVGDKLHVESYAWTNDFGAARNAALECALKRGADWSLFVDTDERFAFPGYKTRSELNQALDGANIWLVQQQNGTYAQDRFIRIPTNAFWHGRVHEGLCSTEKRSILPGCSFYELPKNPESLKSKFERDLVVLLEEVAVHKDKPRWHYYLGQTLECLGETRKAIDAYDNCIMLDGWADESAWACYTAARCCSTLGEYKQAEKFCAAGMTRKPRMPELPWLAGWCCYKRGAYEDAIAWSEVAAALGGRTARHDSGMFVYPPAWWEAPYDVMRWSYKAMGHRDAELAEERFKEMLAFRTNKTISGSLGYAK